MAYHEKPIQRLHFTLKEVAKSLGVAPSALRFYGVEFGLGFGNGNRERYRIRLSVKQLGQLAVIVRLREYFLMEATKEVFHSGKAESVLAILEEKELGGYLMFMP